MSTKTNYQGLQILCISIIFSLVSCAGCGGAKNQEITKPPQRSEKKFQKQDEYVANNKRFPITDSTKISELWDDFNYQIFNKHRVTMKERLTADSLANVARQWYPNFSLLNNPITFRFDIEYPKMFIRDSNTKRILNRNVFLFDQDYNFLNRYNLRDFTPSEFMLEYPIIDTTKQGYPVYSLTGINKAKIEAIFPTIKWDSPAKWEPNKPYAAVIQYRSGVLDLNNEAIGYNLLINGENGPMAALSQIVVLEKDGTLRDTFILNGEQVFSTRTTDDGKFVAVLSGRAFVEEGGGRVEEHLRIYDINKHELIYREFDTKVLNGTIWQKDNLFFATRYVFKNKTDNTVDHKYVFNPKTKTILSGNIPLKQHSVLDLYKEDGVYDYLNPSKRKYTWDGFDSIPFTISKN